MKILGVIGSPRRNGNTHILVTKLLEGAYEAGAITEEIFLGDLKVHECDGCIVCWKGKECNKHDDMNSIYPKIIESDVIVFGTPVYWYGPTALMKAFLDRFVYFNCPENREKLRGKKAVIVIPYEEESIDTAIPVQMLFDKSFRYLEMNLVGSIIVPGVSNKGDVLQKKEKMQEAYDLGRNIASCDMPESVYRKTDAIVAAIGLALRKHEGQFRKGTRFPYIIHPLNVFRLLLMEQANDPEISDDVIIAGILHDAVEDTDMTLEQIETEFGSEVRRLVGTASEPEKLKNDPDQKETWKERKLHTIEQLRVLDRAAKILSCCDKLDNARSMNEDYAMVGNELWDRFNAPKDDIFWYYRGCMKAYQSGESIEDSRIFRLFVKEAEILCSS